MGAYFFACRKKQSRANLAELSAAVCCEWRTTPLLSLRSRQRRFSSPHDNSGHTIKEIVRLHFSCKRQSIAKWGCAKRAPENRNEVRFLGRGGAERAREHCRFVAMRESSRPLRRKWRFPLRELLLKYRSFPVSFRPSVASGEIFGNLPREFYTV